MKPEIVHEDGHNIEEAIEKHRAAFSCKSQSSGSNLALAIAEELVCDFSILNHDGNLMKGEHYWVGLDELKDYLVDCIMRNSNDNHEAEEPKEKR